MTRLPPASAVGLALRMLHTRGFTPLPRHGLARRFEGVLHCKAGEVAIELLIDDWDFVTYPLIRVVSAPAALPSLAPHVDANRGLCYLASGSVVLDRYRPDHALAQCLDIARDELDRLMSNPSYRDGEFQDEFGANWNVGQHPRPWTVLLGTVDATETRATALIVADPGEQMLAVTSHDEEVHAWSRVRGWPSPSPAGLTCWILRSSALPTLPATLPNTVGEMLAWLRSWGPAVFHACLALLGQRDYLAQPAVMLLIDSPAGWFGFSFELDAVKRRAFQKRPKWMRQSLRGRDSGRRVTRVAVEHIGSAFVHSRNLSFPSLRSRTITVIGCGAIGGYLAQALGRLGAGTGGGLLTLIDPERLRPENIGRHWLGYESLYMPKATAVATALGRQFPECTVVAEDRPARLPSDLVGDLIIDASGEEALSEAINFHRLVSNVSPAPPVLHAWILGNGDYCQALWVDGPAYACYRCLRQNDDARSPRFGTLSLPPHTRHLGCQAHTPYATSAPMSTAALAIDLIVGWLQGNVSPRFRTRQLETSAGQQVKSKDLPPLSGCPACSRG